MIAALIAAGGKGTRMGGDRCKQFLPLGDRPMLAYSLQAFDSHPQVDHICLVLGRDDLDACRTQLLPKLNLSTPVTLAVGGAERQASVYQGLCAIPDQSGIVLIHDAARPLVTTDLITACIQGARRWKACVPVVPAADTLKQIDGQGVIQATLDRRSVRLAQTPQAFELPLIKQAHEEAVRNGWQVTDDAAMLERCGVKVHVIEGSRDNIKITVPDDLLWAELWLTRRRAPAGTGS